MHNWAVLRKRRYIFHSYHVPYLPTQVQAEMRRDCLVSYLQRSVKPSRPMARLARPRNKLAPLTQISVLALASGTEFCQARACLGWTMHDCRVPVVTSACKGQCLPQPTETINTKLCKLYTTLHVAIHPSELPLVLSGSERPAKHAPICDARGEGSREAQRSL